MNKKMSPDFKFQPDAIERLTRDPFYRSGKLRPVIRLGSSVGYVGLFSAFLMAGVVSGTDDWPGLLGPSRNGHSVGPKLSMTAAPDSLPLIWSQEAGQGYAGPAISDGQAVLYDRLGDNDRAQLVDLNSGKAIWTRTIPASYRGGIDSDRGPRCVPTMLGNRIVLYSAAGDLIALSKVDGRVEWTRTLRKELQADDGYFGAGSTPLVIGDRAIVNVGGKSAGIVAISLDDGKTLWSATDYDASYASPIAYSVDGPSSTLLAVVPTRLKTVGVDIQSGKVVWEFPFGQRGPTVNAATPIMTNRQLILTASYGIGTRAYSLADGSAAALMFEGDQLSSQYATPVAIDGHVYGSDGREDMGSEGFKCLDLQSERTAWHNPELPICHVIAIADSQLLLIGIDGSVILLDATPTKYSELWSSKLGRTIYRSLPALSRGRLLVRSNSPSGCWECYELPR
jgi:outer membrane protein assembly factor BamB